MITENEDKFNELARSVNVAAIAILQKHNEERKSKNEEKKEISYLGGQGWCKFLDERQEKERLKLEIELLEKKLKLIKLGGN